MGVAGIIGEAAARHPRRITHNPRVLTRRDFLSTAVGTPVLRGLAVRAQSGQFDLLIKGGRVVDPSLGLDGPADVATIGSRIATVRRDIPTAYANQIVDATGKLVVPGLIAIHTLARMRDMPGICLSQGVTTLVDGGSKGADNVDEIVAVAKGAPNRVRMHIN